MSERNVLVLTYWSYRDALIQTYTLPYLRMIRKHLPAGSSVYLVTLEQQHLALSQYDARMESAALHDQGIRWVPLRYSRFGFKAMLKWLYYIVFLAVLCRWQKICRIHAWATPAGAAGYLLSTLTGVPLIIDSYEPHAESMVENGTWRGNGAAFAILSRLERLQSRRAVAVIATTSGMKEYAARKYQVELKRVFVKPAGVDLTTFTLQCLKDEDLMSRYQLHDKIVCVYAGKIGGIYLEHEIFDFLKVASTFWKDRFRVLVLTSAEESIVRRLAAQSGLDPDIVVVKFVEHRQIPRYMGLGDFAINPVKPVPSKRYCTSIKDGEYWALGLPVVIPANISDDSDLIARLHIGSVLSGFSQPAYRAAVEEIDVLLRDIPRAELQQKIRSVATRYRDFNNAESIYRELYGSTTCSSANQTS